MKKFRYFIFTTAVALTIAACERDSFTDEGKSIFNEIEAEAEYSTFTEALAITDFVSTLNGTQYTIFAPSNAAFAAAGINLNTIDKDSLLNILKYHVIPGRTDSTRFDLEYGVFVGQIVRNETRAVGDTANGPFFNWLWAPPNVNRLALRNLNYLGNLTYVGIPTLSLDVNANIYYTQRINVINSQTGVLTTSGIFVNGVEVEEFDVVEEANGVVHGIGQVLLPPEGSAATIIEKDPQLSLFEQLVKRASASTTGTPQIPSYFDAVLNALPTNSTAVARTGTITVLAPTDAAMTAAGLTSGAIAALTPLEATIIARRHVINLRYTHEDFQNQPRREGPAVTQVGFFTHYAQIKKLNSEILVYTNTGTDEYFALHVGSTQARIVTPDILTTNGFVHKIDNVLLH